MDSRPEGLVEIMSLVAPTDQLKLDQADLSVEARCGNIPCGDSFIDLRGKGNRVGGVVVSLSGHGWRES